MARVQRGSQLRHPCDPKVQVMAMAASQNANKQWERMILMRINEVKWFYFTDT
jgi:hypothetical protein